MKYRVPDIIDNYRKLCVYCDSIWNRAKEAYPNEIACRKGCGICCELQSVNQIEAYAIRSYIVNNKNLFEDRCIDNDNMNVDTDDTNIDTNDNTDACPFLHQQSCTIYPARPIICRTHGLILRSSEFPLSKQAASCPYNFPSVHPDDFPPELAADADVITKNLVNLNLAFCMASGIDAKDGAESAESRVRLRDLANAPTSNFRNKTL
ncbi:MAG: YkgJ family cysteine cluster protein [Chitinispirillales bacterium]|nr:YkgJ family cysteine cluster protein [Chitinispirillales bacterium]